MPRLTHADDDQPLLVAEGLSKYYGERSAAATCRSRSIPARCWRSSANPAPARSTLLQLLSAQLAAELRPRVSTACATGVMRDLAALGEAERRLLLRTDWGFVHQDPR